MALEITEMYHSIQGESTATGLPFIFIRLTGCNLRCSYCDSAYAYQNGDERSVEDIINYIMAYDCPRVLITGGEPLMQDGVKELVHDLAGLDLEIFIETNGTLPLSKVDLSLVRCVVMDIKTPGSGEHEKTDWKNIDLLRPIDEIKFVITDEDDFEWALGIVKEKSLTGRCAVIFSPAWGKLDPNILADWIIESNAPVRLGIQLHKVLWPETSRGV